ncbi:hypothetical protein J7L13_02490, partial [bacterium]|nr:hypothetical protein [bacterium]
MWNRLSLPLKIALVMTLVVFVALASMAVTLDVSFRHRFQSYISAAGNSRALALKRELESYYDGHG